MTAIDSKDGDLGFRTELASAAAEAGLALREDQLERMARFRQLVLYWNQRMNLTRIVEDREMAVKHFVDSLVLVRYIPPSKTTRVVDVGSGAGFPGLPLKLWDESLSLTLGESTRKKADFLRIACKELHVEASVLNERAENVGVDPQHRESYDLAVARAVAEFPVLCEYCLPMVRVGGWFVAMKGPGASAEIDAGSRALQLLGGSLSALHSYDLPHEMGRRTLAVVAKVSPTPSAYPRRAGVPAKNPL
jgi:16S rRNA (guanine527-N7)-methyltransferase